MLLPILYSSNGVSYTFTTMLRRDYDQQPAFGNLEKGVLTKAGGPGGDPRLDNIGHEHLWASFFTKCEQLEEEMDKKLRTNQFVSPSSRIQVHASQGAMCLATPPAGSMPDQPRGGGRSVTGTPPSACLVGSFDMSRGG